MILQRNISLNDNDNDRNDVYEQTSSQLSIAVRASSPSKLVNLGCNEHKKLHLTAHNGMHGSASNSL